MKKNTEPRTEFRTTRFTMHEAQELDEHAAACGLSVSSLIRRRVTGKRLPRGAAPAINMQAWRECAPTRANLNQISHKLNFAALSGNNSGVTLEEVQQTLFDVSNQVDQVRLELIGAAL